MCGRNKYAIDWLMFFYSQIVQDFDSFMPKLLKVSINILHDFNIYVQIVTRKQVFILYCSVNTFVETDIH